jgi:hypothetical protein
VISHEVGIFGWLSVGLTEKLLGNLMYSCMSESPCVF